MPSPFSVSLAPIFFSSLQTAAIRSHSFQRAVSAFLMVVSPRAKQAAMAIVGTWSGVHALTRNLCGTRLSPRASWLAGASLLALFLIGVRGPNESIYWLVAAYEYQTADIGLLLGAWTTG